MRNATQCILPETGYFMPTFSGCSTDQTIRLQTAIQFAKQSIDDALDMAFSDNKAFNIQMGKYFSGLGNAGGWGNVTSLVMKTISSMKLTIDSGLYKVTVISNQPANKAFTNAVCASWMQDRNAVGRMQGTMVYNNTRMNVLEAQMQYAKANGPSDLKVYPLFFGLTFLMKDSQCQVQSFLHELSHCAAGTVDIDAPACYGMQGVRYCMRNGESAKNAENIAMFLTSLLV
jgi:hypothetical protein